MRYIVSYELYGQEKFVTCETYAQYSDFIAEMEESFGENFVLKEILPVR